MATSLQWPLFFVPVESPYIDLCIILSTIMANSLQWQQPLQHVPYCQNNLSTMASFFSDWLAGTLFHDFGGTVNFAGFYFRNLNKYMQTWKKGIKFDDLSIRNFIFFF